LYADIDSWEYEGNQALMTDLAKMLWQSRCDTVISGTIRYKGEYTTVLDPGIGHKVSIASNCATTGDEGLNAPVRAVSVKYAYQGGGLLATTEIAVSSRRDPRTSEGMYMHLSQLGSGAQIRGEGNADAWNRAAFGQNFGQGNWREVNAAREAAQQNGDGGGGNGSTSGGGGMGGGIGGVNTYRRDRLDPQKRAAMVAARRRQRAAAAVGAADRHLTPQERATNVASNRRAREDQQAAVRRQRSAEAAPQKEAAAARAEESSYSMPKEDERQKAREDASAAARERSDKAAQTRHVGAMKTRRAGRAKGEQREADAQKIRDASATKAGRESLKDTPWGEVNYPDDSGKA
jgi:flagellar biosynthesis GTPase FlhF